MNTNDDDAKQKAAQLADQLRARVDEICVGELDFVDIKVRMYDALVEYCTEHNGCMIIRKRVGTVIQLQVLAIQ